ncbi:ABC transporter substrate-binding protein [bacterium]|nr:ABC transporter substrate-binding protein [bacterium]
MREVNVAKFSGRHILYVPFHLALHEGFFREAGLEVTVCDAGNDDEVHKEVASQRAEFGIADPSFVIHSPSETCVVAALVNRVANWGFTHNPEIEPITEAHHLVQLRVGCYPRPSTSFALLSALKQKHARVLRSMEIIEAPIGEQFRLLEDGRADLVIDVEPMVSLAEERGLRTVLSMGDFYRELLFTGVTTQRTLCEEQPEVVQSFVSALQRGLTTCHLDPSRAIQVAATLFPALSTSCLERAVHRMLNSRAWPEQAIIPGPSWAAAAELRRKVDDLKTLPSIDECLDQGFAHHAIRRN